MGRNSEARQLDRINLTELDCMEIIVIIGLLPMICTLLYKTTIVHVIMYMDPQINTITNSLSLSHILFDKMTKITCGMTTYTLHYNIELKTPLNKSLKATFPADCSFQSKQ